MRTCGDCRHLRKISEDLVSDVRFRCQIAERLPICVRVGYVSAASVAGDCSCFEPTEAEPSAPPPSGEHFEPRGKLVPTEPKRRECWEVSTADGRRFFFESEIVANGVRDQDLACVKHRMVELREGERIEGEVAWVPELASFREQNRVNENVIKGLRAELEVARQLVTTLQEKVAELLDTQENKELAELREGVFLLNDVARKHQRQNR